jgi:single-stranded DNA-binding protein
MINRVFLMGTIGQYGVKLSSSDHAKPQLAFTLICTETTTSGAYKTFIPILVVGLQAEPLAETLKPGDLVALDGKLNYRAGKTEESGELMVTTFEVRRLTAATPSPNHPYEGDVARLKRPGSGGTSQARTSPSRSGPDPRETVRHTVSCEGLYG